MNHLEEIKSYFEEKKRQLKSSIEKEKAIRDSSPSAMQSHHDTTRNQTEKLIQAFEFELRMLEENINLIPDTQINNSKVNLWNRVRLEIGDNELNIVLVPEGLGGNKINDYQTLAENTPLGKIIKGKTQKQKFEINENKGKILSIQ